MALTNAQKNTLKNDILTSVDPVIIAARGNGADIGRDDTTLAAIYNAKAVPTTKAWMTAVYRDDMFGAMNIAKYDNLTAGKRDSWRMMCDYSPVSFAKAKLRKAVTDIWGAVDAAVILDNFTENASRAEVLFGGNTATESTVTALVRNWTGTITIDDLGQAFR